MDDDLELPRKPLKISTKVYNGAHVQDVGNEKVENDSNSLIATNVAPCFSAAPLSQKENRDYKVVEVVKIKK